MDEKARERERLRQPAARMILAWWRLQSLNNQSRTIRGKDREKLQCKQFIAHMLFSQYCREFRRSRHGAGNENYVQLRRDLHRIMEHLQAIEEKIDTNVRVHNE